MGFNRTQNTATARIKNIYLTNAASRQLTIVMLEFNLSGRDHITLTNLLKIMHLVGTGGEANLHIVDGEVTVNGVVEIQKRKKLRAGDTVVFQGKTIVIQ